MTSSKPTYPPTGRISVRSPGTDLDDVPMLSLRLEEAQETVEDRVDAAGEPLLGLLDSSKAGVEVDKRSLACLLSQHVSKSVIPYHGPVIAEPSCSTFNAAAYDFAAFLFRLSSPNASRFLSMLISLL